MPHQSFSPERVSLVNNLLTAYSEYANRNLNSSLITKENLSLLMSKEDWNALRKSTLTIINLIDSSIENNKGDNEISY